jgi:ketosteroid isomerase-like protein
MGDCIADTAALRGMLETEYEFGARARTAVRTAFLEYLAADSLVLEPAPTPARAFYETKQDDSGKLEWYPALADLAGSGDLGFTTGPWVYTGASGGRFHGHFLTIWKRDAACRWRIEFDGGISHAAPMNAEPPLAPDQSAYMAPGAPPQKLIADDAAAQAIRDFQDTSRQDGFAPGLRTYARTADFRFFADGDPPVDLAAANRRLADHTLPGAWMEDARGRSSDSSLAYCVGVFSGVNRQSRYAYAQLWQYAPKVANWGLRLLLINPLAPSMSK